MLIVLVATALSCKREDAPQTIEYVMENVTADPSYTTCTITCKNNGIDDTSIHAKLLLALNEDLRDAESFPMRLIDGKLTYQLSGLRKGTLYYYGFEIFTEADVYRFKEVYSFNTLISTELRVVTSEITNVGQTSATGGGSVIGGEDIVVSERGICWSTNHNPTIGGEHLSNGYGLGEFEVSMTELAPETRYYVRAYASSSQGTVYGNEVSFTTIATDLPELTTEMVTFITYNSALGRGTVVSEGTAPVTERGLCWSTNHNPTINDSFSDSGQGTGIFTVNITGLTPNTTYYVRAYAIYTHGISYGNEVSFTTLQTSNSYAISVFADPSNGGTVTGGGTYQQGQSCTVTATATNGYSFTSWTENGIVVSYATCYTFTVTNNRTLVANFTPMTVSEIFSESFAEGQGLFTIQNVTLPAGVIYVWWHNPSYSCMTASAYVGQNYATESWLVSPIISLSGVSSAKLTFEQAVNYASPNGALSIMISTNYYGNVITATWNELVLDNWPSGNNWAFITSTANLTQYVGRNVTIAFKYTSTINASATWEVKNFVVVE